MDYKPASKGRQTANLVASAPLDLVTEVRDKCAQIGCTVSSFVVAAVRRELARKQKERKS